MLISLFFAVLSHALVETKLPIDVRGSWAENLKACDKPVLKVEPSSLTLAYKDFSRTYHKFDVCLSCAGGARYEGIEKWVSPIPDGAKLPKDPVDPKIEEVRDLAEFVIYFNVDEKRGRARLVGDDYKTPKKVPVPILDLVVCKGGKSKGK